MNKSDLSLRAGSPLVLLLATVSVFFIASCGLKDKIDEVKDEVTDTTTKTLNALDDAINALNQASSSWQAVLNNTVNKLVDDTQSTVRNEVSNLLTRGIGQAGVEVRCDADFIGTRVREGLIRIKAKLLRQTVPPVKAVFCQVAPLAVERALVPARLNKLEFYGYNFDTTGVIKVFLQNAGRRMDVTNKLDRPTHYAMTLKFGANGVQLTDKSERFIVQMDGTPFSTIAVIQKPTPVCRSQVQKVNAGKVTYIPKHTRGDREYSSNGPKVNSRITLRATSSSLSAGVYMKAVETKKDWTTAEGTRNFPLFTPNPGWRITRVIGNTVTSHSYVDSKHTVDSFNMGSGGPVSRLVYVGDTKGKDAGTRTKVDVTFNPIRLELVENTNCVPARALQSLQKSRLITDQALKRLAPGLKLQLKALQIK